MTWFTFCCGNLASICTRAIPENGGTNMVILFDNIFSLSTNFPSLITASIFFVLLILITCEDNHICFFSTFYSSYFIRYSYSICSLLCRNLDNIQRTNTSFYLVLNSYTYV